MLRKFGLLISGLLLINFSLSAKTQMEDEEWQKQYHHNRVASPHSALAMLKEVYLTISPSAERIYVATRIHGFVTRRGDSYTHQTSEHSKNPYEKLEWLILKSMDLDDKGEQEKTLATIKLAQITAATLNDPDLDALLLLKQCKTNLALGNYFISEFYCQSSIKQLEKTSSHYIDIKWAYRLLALSYQGSSNLEAALTANEKALSFSKPYDINDTSYSNIATLLLNMGHLSRAEEYGKKALDIRIKRNIPQKIAQSKILLAKINLTLAKYDKAESLVRSALEGLQESTHTYSTSLAYYTLGSILHKKELSDEAIEFLLLALKAQERKSNATLTINIHQSLSQIYLEYQNPNKALEYIEIAIEKSKTAQNQIELANSYLFQSKIQELTQDYKDALEAQKKYRETLDLIYAKNTRKAYEALEFRNSVIKTEGALIETLQKQTNQQLNFNQNKYLFVLILIIIAMVFLAITLRSSHWLKNKSTAVKPLTDNSNHCR
ncbi:tetratricopeptide repeat protein [Aliivibrio finisterrensis]|nr:tetratricopeptide repeat protein [Aliivibrio finisterrensis]